jgi:hypothetical protein
VLVVLKNMTDNYEPTPALCADLLGPALAQSDADLLCTLAVWYGEFAHVRLDQGSLSKMLQVAAAAGHQPLAHTSLQVRSG